MGKGKIKSSPHRKRSNNSVLHALEVIIDHYAHNSDPPNPIEFEFGSFGTSIEILLAVTEGRLPASPQDEWYIDVDVFDFFGDSYFSGSHRFSLPAE